MSKGIRLSEQEKGEIRASLREKKSILDIATKIKRSWGLVSSYAKLGDKYATVTRSGRPKVLSLKKCQSIIREASGKMKTVNEIKARLGITASKNTVLRVIKTQGGLSGRRVLRKPVLSSAYKVKRVEFARQYMDLGKSWKRVIFSDEKKFNLDGPDGYAYNWHALGGKSPLLSRRALGGGSVMVWACFNFYGKSNIVFVDESIDSSKYQSILERNLLPFLSTIDNNTSLFQQDNARPHVSRSTKDWFHQNEISCMDWPAYSPDFNPIENLWVILVQRAYANSRQFENIVLLKKTIVEEWNKIENDVLQN